MRAHVLGDRQRGRQPRGADSAHARIALGGVDRDLVVRVVGRRAQANVDGGHLVAAERGHDARRLGAQVGEALACGGGVLPVLDVLRRRTDEHVAEHRRRDEHALRDRRGNRQHDVIDERPRQLVEHDQLPAARGDREAVMAQHAVKLIAAQAGGVD